MLPDQKRRDVAALSSDRTNRNRTSEATSKLIRESIGWKSRSRRFVGRAWFFFFIPFYLIFLCLFLFPVPDLLHFDKKTVVGRIKKGSPRSFTAAAWLNFLDFFFCFFFSHFQSESNDPSTLTGHGSDNGAQQKNSTTPLQPSSPSIQQHPVASSSIQQHPAAASGSRKWTLCTRIQSA